jgi:hypothetical protein
MARVRAVSGFDDAHRRVDARNAIRPDEAWTAQMLALFRAKEVDRLDLLAEEDGTDRRPRVPGPASPSRRRIAHSGEVLIAEHARRHGAGAASVDAVGRCRSTCAPWRSRDRPSSGTASSRFRRRRGATHRMTAVLPDRRRRGIAEAMTRAQRAATRQSGLRTLEGWARTPAIGAATKLGYGPRRSVAIYRKPLR